MELKIKTLIETFESEIESLERDLDALNDNDYVGINTVHALMSEKKKTIERLKSL